MNAETVAAERYSIVSIWFHWIIAALVLFNIIVGIFHDSVPALRKLMGAHMAIGMLVLVLTLARIAWRLGHPAPPFTEAVTGWERTTAKTVRFIFYALLLIMPLTGWIMVSNGRHPHPVNWFGLFNIPEFSLSPAAGGSAHSIHVVLGFAFAALVVLHVAGALRHHLLLRDSVLGRMIPGFSPRR